MRRNTSHCYFTTANRKPPGALRPSIDKSDARLKFSVRAEDFDPRIHFALVCGAKSCPPVRVYEPGIVDDALQMATGARAAEEEIRSSFPRWW